MIVRPRPHWLRLLFVRRGSLVRHILSQQLFTFGLACAVVWSHGRLFHWKVTLTASPFSLMGVSLAIFLGFRINASYDRFWEARKLWGAVLVEVRNLARQALTLVRPGRDVRPFVLGLIGFAASMRNQLRERPSSFGLEGLLPPALIERLAATRFPPSTVALWLATLLRGYRESGDLDPMLAPTMEGSLNQLTAALGGCERIANTPLPFTYSVILHRSTYLYCMLLPFGLVDAIGLLTPLVVCFVSYTFFALEALSDEIEEPFGTMPNDLALDAIVAAIDVSAREMLGETPAPLPTPDAEFVLN
jgi:putative membrane protein